MKRGPSDSRWQLKFDWSGNGPATALPSASEQNGTAIAEIPPAASSVYAVAETASPLPGEFREAPDRKRRVHAREGRRVSTSLPVPKPLPDSILAGHFGHDEAGKPIQPTPDEVRDITENHAYKLMNVLIERHRATGDEWERLNAAFEKGIADYVEDFGPRAGERLRAHVIKIASECLPSPIGRSR